jgi:glycosyltransferase involved in cell wall biosynthesis
MLISCLCPTFNRYPQLGFLLEEAIDCFLRQDYADKELIICNDTPGQTLLVDLPQVRVLNVSERFESLGQKLRHMIAVASGDVMCRWDDDDLSLPHRLRISAERLGDRLEWRALNYWFDDGHQVRQVARPGNTHLMSLWRREVLEQIGGYPVFPLGGEDQAFNAALARAGISLADSGEIVPSDDVFYVYRWNTGGTHLSGQSDGSSDPHRAHWEAIGRQTIAPGSFVVTPQTREQTRRLLEQRPTRRAAPT